MFWAIAAPGIVAATLKQAIGRTRPFLSDGLDTWNLHPWSGFDHASMPSGDVCNAAALAVALSLLFPRYRLAFAAFAVLIATGRLVSERHYLSDVLVGAALGHHREGHHRVRGYDPSHLAELLRNAGADDVEVRSISMRAYRVGYLPMRALWQVWPRGGRAVVSAMARTDAGAKDARHGFVLATAGRRA